MLPRIMACPKLPRKDNRFSVLQFLCIILEMVPWEDLEKAGKNV